MNVIQAVQDLNTDQTIYVCDLHFNKDDFIQAGGCLRLKKDAIPQIT